MELFEYPGGRLRGRVRWEEVFGESFENYFMVILMVFIFIPLLLCRGMQFAGCPYSRCMTGFSSCHKTVADFFFGVGGGGGGEGCEYWSDPRRTHPRRSEAAFGTTRYFWGKIFPGESIYQELSSENILPEEYRVMPSATPGSPFMRLR